MSFALTQLVGFMAGGDSAAAPSVVGTPAITEIPFDNNPVVTTLPTGIVAGEGIIILTGTNEQRNPTATGYTVLYNDDAGSGGRISLLYKTATGSEGSTVSVDFAGGSRIGAIIVFRVSPWVGSIEAPTSVTASLNPPSRTASWGVTAPTLWVAHLGQKATAPTVTAGPTGYVNFTTSATYYCNFATKTTTATSEDPGAFTVSGGTGGPLSATIAIKGLAL